LFDIAIDSTLRGCDLVGLKSDERLSSSWLAGVGLILICSETHSVRRTKATLIYRRTGHLRAVQLLLGHTKIESTVRDLGIEVDDARLR
jgi:integrase